MAPVRYTLESFEDVAGYPGKIFYVLHQYPGTGCRQVPFLAIDKTEDGFKIRELEQHPVEEFSDEKYKFHWPRDPRLQCSSDEAEELMSSEPSPSTVDAPSMPVIQDVQSVAAQTLMVTQDGHSMMKIEADSPITNFDSTISYLPLSSRVIEESSVPVKHINSSISQNPGTSKISLVLSADGSDVTENSGNILGGRDPKVGGETDKSINTKDKNASTPRNVFPAFLNDSVASNKSGCGVTLDKKVDDVPNNPTKIISQNASTSGSVMPGLPDVSVAPKQAGSTVSVDTAVRDMPSKATKGLNHNASPSKIVLPAFLNDSVASRRTDSPVLPSKKVDGVPQESAKIVDLNASTSRTALQVISKDNEPPKKSHNLLPNESVRAVTRIAIRDMLSVPAPGVRDNKTEPMGLSLPFLPCSTDSPASPFPNMVSEPPSVTSTLEPNKLTSRVATRSEYHTVPPRETCLKSSVNRVICSSDSNVAPTDDKEPMSVSSSSVATRAKMDSSLVKSGQTKKIMEEVTPCDNAKVVKEISSLVSNILSDHVKSSNQSNEYGRSPTGTETGNQTPAAVQETPEADKARKEPSLVKLHGISEESPLKSVIKENTSIVNDLISGRIKSNDQINELSMWKIDTVCQPTIISNKTQEESSPLGKSLSLSTSDYGSMLGSFMSKLQSVRSSVHKDYSKKGGELLDRRDKDQTDLKEKYTVNRSIETCCLPRMVEKELCDVDNLITKAKDFVRQKRVALIQNKPVEDRLGQKEKSTKESSAEPGKSELKPKQRSSKSSFVERVDEHKCEKIGKKALTSVPKTDGSGDTLPKGADNALASRRISSEPSLKSSFIGNRPSGVESQSSDVPERPAKSSMKTVSSLDKETSDVFNFYESDDEKVVPKRKAILRRRNTVDGTENKSKGRRKPAPAKYSPYNLQRYKKELEKHRPTKKLNVFKTVKTQNPCEKPNDDGGSTTTVRSYSCPGSPVSKSKKSSIEDIFNLQAILTDDSSACNYSDITLKGPVHVASNASPEKPSGSPLGTIDDLKPTVKDKTVRSTSDEQIFSSMRKKVINARSSKGDGSAEDSDKSSGEAPQNSESNLTNYAEAALSQTPKHDQNTKKKERKNKLLALMKERHVASQTTSVGVIDKGSSSTGIKSGTPKVGESSKHSPLIVGMHKLPAMVSSRGTQLKPVPLKKLAMNDLGLATHQIEMKRGEDSKTSYTTDTVKKVDDAKDLPKPSDVESDDKVQDEQLGDESVKSLKVDCSRSRKSPLLETPKVQLALKRQKKFDSTATSLEEGSTPTKMTKTTSLLDKEVPVSSVSGTSLIVSSSSPFTKRIGDESNKDTKKDIDVNKNPDKETSKVDYVGKTEIKNKINPSKNSSKLDVSKKSSSLPTSGNKHANPVKQSAEPGDGSKEVPSALEVDAVQTNKSLIEGLRIPALKAIEPCMDKGSPVCSGNVTAADETPPIVNTVTVSDSMFNFSLVGSESSSDPTVSFPTTESRKKLLRQLQITEKELLLSLDDPSKKPTAQEELLGSVSIGSNDLIEDKIKAVVADIVKVKIEIKEREKNKNRPMDPPTAEELGEYYSEIFEDDTTPSPKEITVLAESAAEPINTLASTSTAPVVPGNTSVSMISKPTVSVVEIDTIGIVEADHISKGEQNVFETHQNSIDKPRKRSNLNAKLPTIVLPVMNTSLSEASTNKDKLVSSKNSCSSDGKSKGSSSLESVSVAPVLTVEISGKNKNQKESVPEDVTELSSDSDSPAPEVDLVEMSSPESVVEIVDVDDISSTSQISGMPSSRKMKKRRRIVVDEHVPTIAALTRNRRMRGNRLALLRKLVAQRFSIEPFSPKSKNRSSVKLKSNQKHVSTNEVMDVEAPSSETNSSSDASNNALEMTKPEDAKSTDGVMNPEVIKQDVQHSFPEITKPVVDVSETVVIKPVVEVTKSVVTKPVFDSADTEVIQPVVEVKVTEPDVFKPPVEVKVKELEFIKPAGEVTRPLMEPDLTEPVLELTKSEVVKPVVLATEPDVIKPPVEGKVTEPGVFKPPVEVKVTESDVFKPPVEVKVKELEVIKPADEVTEPEITRPLMEVIEIEEDPLSQPNDVAFISGESNSELLNKRESIPFLEDEEYPPKSVPHTFFVPKPIEMPKPLITLSSRTRDEDDDLIEITDTISSSGISNRSSSKRLPTEGSEQSKKKRLCAIPAPKLLPVSSTYRPVTAKDKIPLTPEPVMPQPMVDFQNSPAKVVHVEPEEETDQSVVPSSSSTPKRGTSLSQKLRARLGERCLNIDVDVSPHSGNSTTARRVSIVPSEGGRVLPQPYSDHHGSEKEKKKKLKPVRGFHETCDVACQGSASSTSQNDSGNRQKVIPKIDHRRLGVWRREVRTKKVRLDSPPIRSEECDPSSVEGEHNRSSSHRHPQKEGTRDNCSTSSRETRLGGSRSKWSKIRNKEGSSCSPPHLPESRASSINQSDTLPLAGCKTLVNSRPMKKPPSTGGGNHYLENTAQNPSSTRSTSNSRSPPERWERPTSKGIFKVDREEAAWRTHQEDGRRFLGRRLKRFSHPDPNASETHPHSSQSSPETRRARESKDRGSRRCSPSSSQDGQSLKIMGKKLRSSSHYTKGPSDVPDHTPIQKERPSSRGKGVGPGYRKGDRRKTEGGPPTRQLRSAAHMSRSGLIRNGDI